jgi:hypothetical protein
MTSRAIHGFVAAAGILPLFACGMTAPSGGWSQVKEQTTCEALAPAFCVGAFGFTVQNDGRFTVGPADDGSMVSGALSASERAQVASDVALVSADLAGASQCDGGGAVPGVSDKVDLVDVTAGTVRVFDLGGTVGSTCYRGGRDNAVRLHTDLSALMSRYYPRPFPG